MAEIAVLNKENTDYDLRDKKLADASTSSTFSSGDAIIIKRTGGSYFEVDRSSFINAIGGAVYGINVISSVSAITTSTSSVCSITGASNNGKSETIIYTNSSGSDLTVTVPTTYKTPDGNALELTCPNGGYCEVNYLNISGTIYARGI